MTRLAVPSQHSQLRIVGKRDAFKASRVQRLGITTDVPTNDIYELGNENLAGITQDSANISVTFSAFDTGIKIFSALTGTDSSAYPALGVDAEELTQADVIVDIKDEELEDIVKTGHGRRLQVQNFSFSYGVDQEATEDYTMTGSEKRWFKNDVIVDKFITGTTSFTLSQTPIQLKNGNYALSVIVDGEYLTEVTAAPGTDQYRIVGTTLTTGNTRTAQVLAVYHASPAGLNWVNLVDSAMPAAVKGKDIPIQISANRIPRVQSITINGNLNSQPVKEMGTRDVVGYQKQVTSIDGTITVLDTDTELMSLLTTGVLSGVGVTEYLIGESCPTSGVSLLISILDPCDISRVLKQVYLDQIIVTNDSWSANVQQNATQNYNFKSITGNLVVYSGEQIALV